MQTEDKVIGRPKCRRCYFVCVDEKILSGQRRATELLIEELSARGWTCQRLSMPNFDRFRAGHLTLALFIWRMLGAWYHAAQCFVKAPGLVHINLGQTTAAILREGTPLVLSSLLMGVNRAVISLHGSWFMQWSPRTTKARWLVFLVRRAAYITVLGLDQRLQLESFGIDAKKILVVDNTCEVPALDAAAVAAKHQSGQTVRVLFLSHLVDTKGYPEFLSGLEIYSRMPTAQPIEAVLCGRIIPASHATRYITEEAAREYILGKIDAIQVGGRIRIKWITGVEGAAKAKLFASTTVFVFPSHLEAQPLVLIEAMATGCAIITSSVGQIPTMLSSAASIQLARPTAEAIAESIRRLVNDAPRRKEMALAGLREYEQRFTRVKYGETWHSIMAHVADQL